MAFATKYRIEGSSDIYGKVTINIKKDGYSGSVINLDGAGRDFVTLQIGSPSNDISTTILPGTANIQFYCKTEFQTIELAQSEIFTFLVEINDVNGENIWSGWVMPEEYSESYTNTPYLVTIVASDFLDGLKNVQMGSLLTTKTTLWNAIRTALAGTRLELRYIESISIYSDGMADNNQDSPLTQAEVVNSTFDGLNCYDAINIILKPFFARIYQYRGWRIENITEKRDNYTQRLYNYLGVYQTFSNSLSLVQLDSQSANFRSFVQKSGVLNFKPSLNSSSSYFKSIERKSATGLQGFDKLEDWTSSSQLVSWTNENGITIQRVVTEYNGSEYGVWIDGKNDSFSSNQYIQSVAIAVDPTDNQNINIQFDYKMDYPSVIILGSKPILYVEFFLDGIVSDYYWTGTQWVTDRKSIRISASPRNLWQKFSANIGILPESGNLYIRIHKLVKSGTTGVTKLFLTKFSTNIQTEAEETDIYLYSNANSGIDSVYKSPSFEFGIADGLILGTNGVMEFGSVLTDNWNRAGETDDLPITSLFLLQWLSFHQYSTALLQGTVYQKGELVTPVSTIEDDPSISTKRYILNSWDVSLGSGIGLISYREIPPNDIAVTIVSGTRTTIDSNEYLIPAFPLPSQSPTQNPTINPETPGVTFDNIRFLNGDVTGDISTAELTPSAIVNKARLDTTGLTATDIVFNAVKDTPDQENMTNLRLSDTYPILDTTFVPYTGAKANTNLGEFGLSTGYVTFDTTPTNTPTDQGTTYWDEDDNTVAIVMNGSIQKVGEDSFYPVKNQSGSTIAKGVAVRFAGTVGASGRLLIEPFIANGSVQSSRFMGVTMEEILNGEDGKVLWFGRLRGINTNAFNEGDILYASTTSAGGFQTAIPVAPNNIVQVAAVVTKSINNGTIFVRPTISGNINKTEGVKIVSPTTGDLLQLQSGGLWENKSLLNAGIIGGSITSGQVAFGTATGVIGGDNNLFWDNTNKRLGVGINSPLSPVHISGFNESLYADRYGSGAIAPVIILRKANGSPSSPSAVLSGETLGVFGFRGYGLTSFSTGSRSFLVAIASENWSNTAQGSLIGFGTTVNGSTTGSVKMQILGNGNVIIQNGGTFTDAGFRLDVNGTARMQGATTINGTLSLRASTTASAATHIPVFTGDPASTTRELVTRTPSQFRSDIGAGLRVSNGIYTANSAYVAHTGTGGTSYFALYTLPYSYSGIDKFHTWSIKGSVSFTSAYPVFVFKTGSDDSNSVNFSGLSNGDYRYEIDVCTVSASNTRLKITLTVKLFNDTNVWQRITNFDRTVTNLSTTPLDAMVNCNFSASNAGNFINVYDLRVVESPYNLSDNYING